MAIYHCSIKIINRGKGKSAVAAAAYRSGEKLINKYDGLSHDYTKKGGVIHSEILIPNKAPREYLDREKLWNAVEKVEKARNSQLAREIEISLPNELNESECIALAREFAQHTFVDKGMCADVCIHNPSREQKNIHAHIMLTMRPFNDDGTWGDKQRKEYILDGKGEKIYDKKKRTYKCKTVQTTDWNSKEKAEEWRCAWGRFLNSSLAERGIEKKVDHRSFERQGKEEKPTIHLGASATQMERKGIKTVKGDINRRIKEENARLREIKKQLERINIKISGLSQRNDSENLIHKLLRYHENGLRFTEARGLKLSTLKLAGKLSDLSVSIAFLQKHDINTIEEMTGRLNLLNEEYAELKREVKSRQFRMKKLAELINNYENYKPNKSIFKEYESIANPKKKVKFYDAHRKEIETFKAIREFFHSKVGKGKITPKLWKSEYEKLKKQVDIDAYRLQVFEEDIAIMSTIAFNVDRLSKYEDKPKGVRRNRVEEIE